MNIFLVMKFLYLFMLISILVNCSTVTIKISLRPPSYSESNVCTTPLGDGHCRSVTDCAHLSLTAKIHVFLEYPCIFQRQGILHTIPVRGVCCPDTVKSTSSKEKIDTTRRFDATETDESENTSSQIVYKPDNRECGVITKQTPKIYGGRQAKPGHWPWMAAIIRHGNTIAQCGGTLITDQHVLTAAHCFGQDNLEDIYIRLGEYDFGVSSETMSEDFRALWIRKHMNYNHRTNGNDIAVVKLDRQNLVNSNFWPVCMPPLGETWEGQTGIVMGWGATHFAGRQSRVLLEVDVPILTQKKCGEAYSNHTIGDSFLCAGPKDGSRNSCVGDSGGPLLVQLPNERYAVVGIVSWGDPCGLTTSPGVYLRVDRYLSWIMEKLKD